MSQFGNAASRFARASTIHRSPLRDGAARPGCHEAPEGVRSCRQRVCPAADTRQEHTKSAASSASLRSVLRGVPICARMVRPRAKSVTWIARTATGKSDGISPAVIPSRKRPSTSATPPAAAFCRNFRTSASFTSGATHTRRHPRADPFSVALSTAYLRKAASESRRVCGDSSALAARAPFFSAYALRTRKNIARLSPKTAYRLGRPTPIPATRSSIVDSVVALRPEYLGRLFQRVPLVEAARPSTRPSGHFETFSSKLLDTCHHTNI